jgi:hypothetical protein
LWKFVNRNFQEKGVKEVGCLLRVMFNSAWFVKPTAIKAVSDKELTIGFRVTHLFPVFYEDHLVTDCASVAASLFEISFIMPFLSFRISPARR